MKTAAFRIDGRDAALGWESTAPGAVRLELPGEGRVVEASIERLGDGSWRVSFEGNAFRVESFRAREGLHLAVDGASSVVVVAEGTRKGPGAAAAPSRTLAPLPGIVRKVLTAPGDAVTRGQVVVLMEAMKMECPVQAGRDGTVRKILVEPGRTVDAGTELVTIE